VWLELCLYWCSKHFFLAQQRRGEKARLLDSDIAQNHGGSRPFTETQHIHVNLINDCHYKSNIFYGLWLYNKTPARNNLITELAARSKLQRKVRWQQSQSAGVRLWMRCNHDGGWSFKLLLDCLALVCAWLEDMFFYILLGLVAEWMHTSLHTPSPSHKRVQFLFF
jgi:hypothetical protein